MRKIVVCQFVSLDGVIQNEPDTDEFKYGGWFFPYADEVTGAAIRERLDKPNDLLLGRKTFETWENYWPQHSDFWPNVMSVTKYVASNTRTQSTWQPTKFLSGDLTDQIIQLKLTPGADLYVMGSANLLQTLFRADLVDRIELMIVPITLGNGKRLFQQGTLPLSYTLTQCKIAPKGMILAYYDRIGPIETQTNHVRPSI